MAPAESPGQLLETCIQTGKERTEAGGRTRTTGKPENEDEHQEHAAVGQPGDVFLWKRE